MRANDEVERRSHNNPLCDSAEKYAGPSPAGSCMFAADPSCKYTGADVVVGALLISRKRLDLLDWTPPYTHVHQIIVKAKLPIDLGILKIFQPFTWQVKHLLFQASPPSAVAARAKSRECNYLISISA